MLRDDAQLARLQQLGMNQFEEAKLLALRDYIIKLAHASARYCSTLACILGMLM